MNHKKIIAFGSGKGGVGNSLLMGNLATLLSIRRKNVILADAHWGGSYLHNYMGVELPERTLRDFVLDTYTNLHSVLVRTPHSGVQLICSASDLPSFIVPSKVQKQRYEEGLAQLDTEWLFLDMPSGYSPDVLDKFGMAHKGVVILEPSAPSIESSFLFVKNVLFRSLHKHFCHHLEIQNFLEKAFVSGQYVTPVTMSEILHALEEMGMDVLEVQDLLEQWKPCFILNKVRSDEDLEVLVPFQALVRKYLGVELSCIGTVRYSDYAHESIEKKIPVVLDHPDCPMSLDLISISEKLIEETSPENFRISLLKEKDLI